MYITHRFIVPDAVEYREYQVNIARECIKRNTLVVLPTGLGKTVIALLVIADILMRSDGKILFLAPTKPLVLQHADFLKKFLNISDNEIIVFTGETPPKKRSKLWEEKRIIISTPQVIENDILSNRINLETVSLIIYDEAHHAVGRYAYVTIAEKYRSQGKDIHVLGMTASPGRDMEKILEVCKNLGIDNIEIRTKYDRDVKPYVHRLNIVWKHIPVPKEFSHSIQLLRKILASRLERLKNIGVLDTSSVSLITKTKLLEAQEAIRSRIQEQETPPGDLYEAAVSQSEALKIYYAIELLQTQGVKAVKQYFSRLRREASTRSGSKSSKRLMRDPDLLEVLAHINSLNIEHPKIKAVREVIEEQLRDKPDSRIIVFTHFRDTSTVVVDALSDLEGVRAVRFIGQSSKNGEKGLTQRQQAEIIEKFKEGVYNVLVATSVAEEGLDIPSTELVVFYEPIPSEIRNIQRRGRTGRKMPGKIVILIAKGTQDEGYYWAAKRRERQMEMDLKLLKSKLAGRDVERQDKQKKLEDFKEDSITIIVDSRENRSNVIRFLSEYNVNLKIQQLPVGDYILSSRIGVERKQVDDFLQSLVKGSLFQQIQRLRDSYSRPFLIIEGEGLLTKRNMNRNAILGSIVAIIVDFGIPVIFTKNAKETADILFLTARREQEEKKHDIALRTNKPSMSLRDKQLFIVEGFPNVSSVIAERLLEHFGSIRSIVNASEEELQEVQGVGPLTASDIYKILNTNFGEEK